MRLGRALNDDSFFNSRAEFQRVVPQTMPLMFPTCFRPFDVKQPNASVARANQLALLVRQCQTHNHTHTCNKFGNEQCRFEFPRRLVDITNIDTSQTIRLQREDHWINAYNPACLLALRCNMDIRLVQSGKENNGAIGYTTEYVTKDEFRTHNKTAVMGAGVRALNMAEAQGAQFKSEADRARSLVTRAVNQFIGKSERSGPKVAAMLLGLPEFYCSHNFVNVFLPSFERFVDDELLKEIALAEAKRGLQRALPAADSDSESDSEGDVPLLPPDAKSGERLAIDLASGPVLISDRLDYLQRTAQLENVCLYEMTSLYERAHSKRRKRAAGDLDINNDVEDSKASPFFVARRQTPLIPNLLRPNRIPAHNSEAEQHDLQCR